MSKVYKKFKAKTSANIWYVVTDDKEEIVIVEIPTYLKHQKSVATALSSALSNSRCSLTDLI